jgi:uncharacterized membrane protein YgdD (TMEM256/DUF423 family)
MAVQEGAGMVERGWQAAAAALGFTAVAAGAFGAHGLESAGDAHGAELMGTGSRYQMWHALAILTCFAAKHHCPPALWLWAVGAVLFPCSLYALALGAPRALGLITPVGGTALLLGWLALVWHAVSTKD